MFIFTASVFALTASISFTAYWLRGKRLRIPQYIISILSGSVICALLLQFVSGWAFFASMISGQAVCLIYSVLRRDRDVWFPELCIYIGADTVWLPVCLCDDNIWRYAVYAAAGALCVSLSVYGGGIKKQIFSGDAILSGKMRDYVLLSLIPCAAAVPEVFILSAVGKPDDYVGLLLCAAFLIIYCVFLWLQRELAFRLEAEHICDAQSRWQQESRDYMNTIRSQRHDFNLHLHAISGLLSGGDYDGCRKYVQKLVSDAADVNDIMPVSDAVVGSMLYNMREEARRRGTDIVYNITYDMEDIACNGFECNKIIGNLLANAIDALEDPQDKEYGIRLDIFKRRGNTVIRAENRYTGDRDRIARVFEAGYSTKKDHEGIGLPMVMRTVSGYGGRVYPEFEGDMIRFIVNIPNKTKLYGGGDGD